MTFFNAFFCEDRSSCFVMICVSPPITRPTRTSRIARAWFLTQGVRSLPFSPCRAVPASLKLKRS